MTDAIAHYQAVLDEEVYDLESISIVVVTGATRTEVAAALEVDLDAPTTEWPDWEIDDMSGYSLTDLPDGAGVLAVELSGYADPSLAALRLLTRGGRAAAVVRDDIKAHLRFAGARDGEIVFDDDSINILDADDAGRLPDALRPLFDQAWGSGADDDPDDEALERAFPTALAMAEIVTGVRLTADDLRAAHEAGYRPAPTMRYAEGLGDEA